MKKISRNNDDVSFENKLTFEDIINKIRALGASVIKNGKGVVVTGLLIGAAFFSIGKAFVMISSIPELIHDKKSYSAVIEESLKYNDELISSLSNSSIIVSDLTTSIEKPYYIENKNLYNKNGKLISLKGNDTPIFFNICNIDKETLSNLEMPLSHAKQISFAYTSIDNECIKELPNTVEELSIDYCNYVTDFEVVNKK